MSETLLSCPFCGGEAEIYTEAFGGVVFYVWCDNCKTRGDYYCTEAEAIAAWNSRAERVCENLAYYSLINFECSVCGCSVHGGDELGANIENGRWNNCPNCGRKVKR